MVCPFPEFQYSRQTASSNLPYTGPVPPLCRFGTVDWVLCNCVWVCVCVSKGSPCPSIPATNTVQPRSGDADGTRPDISQDAGLGGFTPNARVDTWVYWIAQLRRV